MSTSFTPHAPTLERMQRWRDDPDVIGIVQVGSRTRGLGDATSDDDLEVLLSPDAFARLEPAACHEFVVEGEGAARRVIYDAQLTCLAEYRRKLESSHDLDHWPYERAVVHHDTSGEIAGAVQALAAMPESFRRARIRHAAIDAWASLHRAQKTRARGLEASARLVLDRAVRALSRIAFALEDRWVPLEHWWESELGSLADPHGLAPRLMRGVTESDSKPLFEALEALAAPLEHWGVPPDLLGRRALFLTLIHVSNVDERARHATP
ncbi:MAG: DUF4037 domain-containing protein [Candidatus Eisenbacteria bacterium]|uniref:DUF4037 domain-containing protein n=1 Tax=Eiseniibacteriota bacterium TaxID=2212470 RepID=A0A849SCZ7_UNCEI|nr:DUF4037 domain-containing protein [Candidatus Eisenbacteria bacterium]